MIDNRRRKVMKEHIVLIEEPGSNYIGHMSPPTGSAAAIAECIRSFLEKSSISQDELQVIGCDGTNINTGHKGGIVTVMENDLMRPLQRFICQLHANELPLRHLINYLDGDTTCPSGFSGLIGKELRDCEKRAAVPFERIDSELKIILKNDLSTDQFYLYEMCQGITTGFCSESLLNRNPGKIVHSRWITTANQVLRLYVSMPNPSEKLVIIAKFIVKVYAPSWFNIKLYPPCVYGAKHLFTTIQLSRYLPSNLKAIVDPIIQSNGFFGHPENILIAMLADHHKHIRELAICRIIKARKLKNISIYPAYCGAENGHAYMCFTEYFGGQRSIWAVTPLNGRMKWDDT